MLRLAFSSRNRIIRHSRRVVSRVTQSLGQVRSMANYPPPKGEKLICKFWLGYVNSRWVQPAILCPSSWVPANIQQSHPHRHHNPTTQHQARTATLPPNKQVPTNSSSTSPVAVSPALSSTQQIPSPNSTPGSHPPHPPSHTRKPALSQPHSSHPAACPHAWSTSRNSTTPAS